MSRGEVVVGVLPTISIATRMATFRLTAQTHTSATIVGKNVIALCIILQRKI
jgi:hypothetical protein